MEATSFASAVNGTTRSEKRSNHFTEYINLRDTPIDTAIVYKSMDSPGAFTYVFTTIDLNRKWVCGKFSVSLYIDRPKATVRVSSNNNNNVKAAAAAIRAMVAAPIHEVTVDDDDMVVLRILKGGKKTFSTVTGCFLHFVWAEGKVLCFGLDAKPAQDYLANMREVVRKCRDRGGYNGFKVFEQEFAKTFKPMLKKYVDHIETKSGAKVVVKRPKQTELVTVQFYGTDANISAALDVIMEEILTRPTWEGLVGPFPATPFAPTDVPKSGRGRTPSVNDKSSNAGTDDAQSSSSEMMGSEAWDVSSTTSTGSGSTGSSGQIPSPQAAAAPPMYEYPVYMHQHQHYYPPQQQYPQQYQQQYAAPYQHQPYAFSSEASYQYQAPAYPQAPQPQQQYAPYQHQPYGFA